MHSESSEFKRIHIPNRCDFCGTGLGSSAIRSPSGEFCEGHAPGEICWIQPESLSASWGKRHPITDA